VSIEHIQPMDDVGPILLCIWR